MRRFLVLTMFAALLVPFSNAHADDCASSSTATAERPALIDLTQDWTGNLGSQSDTSATIPAGDIWREGTDITKAWISGTDGHLKAHIGLGSPLKIQRGTEYFFLWQHGDVPPNSLDVNGFKDATRFVQLTMLGYGEEYSWGYIGGPSATGGAIYRTDGSTTGSVTEGANGEITIDIPTGDTLGIVSGQAASAWGSPGAEETLTAVSVEVYMMLGTPEALPPNPSGLRHGLLEPIDDTTNAVGPDQGDVCEVSIDA